MNKLLYVFNPIAGKGILKDSLFEVVDTFTKKGYELTVYPSQAPGDITKKIKGSSGFNCVVVSGGDGSLKEVVTGLLQSDLNCPIGYLPAGTTNDFANTLNLHKELHQGIQTICYGKPLPIDVGKFNEDYFIYVAAFGMFTGVAYETPQLRKHLLGHFAYVLEGITQLSQIKSYPCKIVSEERQIEDEFIFGMVSNSDSVGGFKNIFGTRAELADGMFEVSLIKKPKQLADLRRIVTGYLNKDYDHEHVITFKTNHLRIDSLEPIHWTLDGEDGGITTVAEIGNIPSAVAIMVD